MHDTKVRPFLKWAGGKYKLLDRLAPHLKGRKLIEPFVGGGSVFLNLDFERYLLGDINPDLINLYQCLKRERGQFISYAGKLFTKETNQKETFSALRDEFNQGAQGRRRAALFVYLNRHGYNGLCRYNKSGKFNVPFGRYSKPLFPEAAMLNFIKRARLADFVCADFRQIMNRARKGDVVYCDPPYVPLSASANFTAYAASAFGQQQQWELADRARHLASRGVKVVISNHDNPLTREIYQGASIQAFPVQRLISRDAGNRGKAKELMAIFE